MSNNQFILAMTSVVLTFITVMTVAALVYFDGKRKK